MLTRFRYSFLTTLLLSLAVFTLACDSNTDEETVNTSDNVMYSTPDAEDTNYDNEVTVDQATPFSEETAVASETYSQNRDFGTQPRDANPEKELEYFNNAYRKAYSTSTTEQRAVVPGYNNKRTDNYDDTTPFGYGDKAASGTKQETTTPPKSAEWSRSDNPTDYVKPDTLTTPTPADG